MSRMHVLRRVFALLLLSGVAVLLGSCNGAQCVITTVSYDDLSRPLPIMSCGSAQIHDLVLFVLHTDPQADVNEVARLARLYIEEAIVEGVNHDVAFCQMCLETNYLRFGGDVRREQNNFAGIGATGNGVPGDSFKSVRTGIRAQIQHLKAYASKKRLRHKVVDPRFWRVHRGSAPHVENLSGKWATDPDYGDKIRKKLRALARQLYQ